MRKLVLLFQKNTMASFTLHFISGSGSRSMSRDLNKDSEESENGSRRGDSNQDCIFSTFLFFLLSNCINLFHHKLNYCVIHVSSGSFNSCVVKDNVISVASLDFLRPNLQFLAFF